MIVGKVVITRSDTSQYQLEGLQTESLTERLGGLLVLDKLTENQCLWITSCNSIHMIGMRYALDIIYLDKHNIVCGLKKHIKPWRVSFNWRAKSTIEALPNTINRLDIKLGDSIQWQD